jgi:hypothetical protein
VSFALDPIIFKCLDLICDSMIAVMTMNVGYFMSVLGGIWLGTFIMGSVAAQTEWMHCI